MLPCTQMRFIIILIALFVLPAGCSPDNKSGDPNTCPLSDPMVNTPWIQNIITNHDCVLYAGAKLSVCSYKATTYFYLENPASSLGICVRSLYNCKGQKVLDGAAPDANWQAFLQAQANLTVLWTK